MYDHFISFLSCQTEHVVHLDMSLHPPLAVSLAFAQHTSAGANDTLSKILRSKYPAMGKLDHLWEEVIVGQPISCHVADVLEVRRNPHLLGFMSFNKQSPI